MRNSVLALADDLTGALEIGAKFAQQGLPATVITDLSSLAKPECPVLIIDTETRHIAEAEAGSRIRYVAECTRSLFATIIYKKTDSTLRGNIAAEFRAIQDVYPDRLIVYAPAYPDMGRTVKNGELFVWGTPVHQTEFANDRRSPVRDSSIRAILGDVPALILDGECNADIHAAAGKILECPAPQICAGPAALAGALAERLHPGKHRNSLPSGLRCLVVNGSLHPASIRQMSFAQEQGLFNGNWKRLDEEIEGADSERALETGLCVRHMLASSSFDALIVFGGDTAFGIHCALGALPFESIGEIAPGVPISRSGGLLWITKAGGFGPPDLLSTIRNRLT
ncbi:MAG TPA: four-carbon acid sugar kinase family protein [Bryobacteraceae bacterium]|jgi:uncharacterized protein YgbK (DUF1537 family)|nr:four-carbon acid sugar kinase family protein [Bryobacteraceae bacterium]